MRGPTKSGALANGASEFSGEAFPCSLFPPSLLSLAVSAYLRSPTPPFALPMAVTAPPTSASRVHSQLSAFRLTVARWGRRCSMSMNGCASAVASSSYSAAAAVAAECPPLGVCETRVLPVVACPELALPELMLALAALRSDAPAVPSGIIRIEVPIRHRWDAIEWLQAQQIRPRCFFSGRNSPIQKLAGGSNGGLLNPVDVDRQPVSVAGVGAAVFFNGKAAFSIQDWKSVKRFLSTDNPLIRAYGAIRFDARSYVAPEWRDYGSFYFFVPQIEFDELHQSSILSATVAWDDSLHLPWKRAVNELQATIQQIKTCPYNLRSKASASLRARVISLKHVPEKASWNTSVSRALQMIKEKNSNLVKVVLARCSRYVTDTCVDPITLLTGLKVEGCNAYQFCIQPSNGPAFVGNSPEQLFHRKYLNISSEALAGTRGRGSTEMEDLQIGQELLLSQKENNEFTIVRDSIKKRLEGICNEITINPMKALRKLPRVQHLSANLSGNIGTEEDEFAILKFLHPSPAVCGLPTEAARQFIEENELFDRGMYAGPVGWFGGTESQFAVGIRSALIGEDHSALVFAGAGIVEGTSPSSEWDELDLKTSQFTRLLQHNKPLACNH